MFEQLRAHRKVILITLGCLAVVASLFIFWKLHTSTRAIPSNAAEWKMYENKDIGYSILYPPTFMVYERAIPEDGYVEVAIDDPATNYRYAYTRSYSRQSDIDNAKDYFTGPYPKQIAPTGNLPNQTAVERTLNGMQGVEVYGHDGDGAGYNDQFLYLHNGRLWMISLDPLIEGHATLQDLEPGTPAPTETYKQNYESILQGISIWDSSTPVNLKTALTQLQTDVTNVTPHFIATSEQGQVLTSEEQKIEADVAAVLSGQYSVANPNERPLTFTPGMDFSLEAVGKNYILITQEGSDKSNDAILDIQTGSVTPIPGNVPLWLTPNNQKALYILPQSIYTYVPDQDSAVLVPESQLSGTETYHDGVEALGIIVEPQQTHTNDSITISIFDSSKVIPNPDGGTKYMKIGQKTVSF
jgi:hypothetical protein